MLDKAVASVAAGHLGKGRLRRAPPARRAGARPYVACHAAAHTFRCPWRARGPDPCAENRLREATPSHLPFLSIIVLMDIVLLEEAHVLEEAQQSMRRTRRALAIMAKAPLPGQAKTRLAAVLGAAQAAELHCCFLLDTLALRQRLTATDLFVCCPAGEHAGLLASLLAPLKSAAPSILAQRSHGLLAGLSEAFELLSAAGYRRIALIDADSPTLPPEYLVEAFGSLERADLTLGPCDDGGYYLIAARRPHPWLFLDGQGRPRRYDAAHICAQTAALARAGGLRVATVEPWYDVDTLPDLERLRAELAGLPAGVAVHTRRWLAGARDTGAGAAPVEGLPRQAVRPGSAAR